VLPNSPKDIILNSLNISVTIQLKNDLQHIALFNSKTHSTLTFFSDGEDTNSSHGKPFCSPLETLKKKVFIYIYISNSQIFKSLLLWSQSYGNDAM
jgi:hypothetical protein